jgi:DNA-binding MarR family transcriptional regulator
MASEESFPEVRAEFATAPRVVAQIRRGSTRLARRLRSERPADSLSLTKLSVLAHLYRAGAASPGEIAAAERLQPQSLTRVLADLEAEGLISRERDERDRRQSVLELTEAGGAALAFDMGARDRWLAGALEELTETERQVLYLAGKLMDRLSGLGRPAGVHQHGPAEAERAEPAEADPAESAGAASADQERGLAHQGRAEGEHVRLREQHGEQPERDDRV